MLVHALIPKVYTGFTGDIYVFKRRAEGKVPSMLFFSPIHETFARRKSIDRKKVRAPKKVTHVRKVAQGNHFRDWCTQIV